MQIAALRSLGERRARRAVPASRHRWERPPPACGATTSSAGISLLPAPLGCLGGGGEDEVRLIQDGIYRSAVPGIGCLE